MCWSCNPYCGNCKPPKERPIICPQCKKVYINITDEPMKCKKCGSVLPKRPPRPIVNCLYSGLICANPCGKYKDPPKDGIIKPCKLNTPPKDPLDK